MPDLFNNQDEDDLIEIESSEANSVEETDELVSPFDPKDIKIIVEPKTIDHLVQRLRFNEIDLNTEFQRKGNLWKPDAQSRLIESILLRFPLPAFYFDAEDENNWLVVDGLQRLWTIKNFVVNASIDDVLNQPLELNGLEILTDYNAQNIRFTDLTRMMQRRILETPITTYLIQPGTPKLVKYNIFRRINTGGISLNSMEIRNALNQGRPSDFLRNLSDDPQVRSLIKVQDKRMEDRELFLRAIAFINENYLNYTTPLSSFLDKAMENLYRKTDLELADIKAKLVRAINVQQALFGRHLFSRSIDGSNKLKLNSALFEVWVSELFYLTENEVTLLIANRDHLIEDYVNLIANDDFSRAISTSTSGYSAVVVRFEGIQHLINKYSN